MHEYTFDVKMFAVIRVKARNLNYAKKILDDALDCAGLQIEFIKSNKKSRILEAPVYIDDVQYPFLTELDGISTDDDDLIIK